MARLNGILSKLKGSVGSLTFKQNGGQTVVSEKITKSTNSKTESQQKQRMKWTNVIRLYQVLVVYLKLAFEGSRNGRNDYNKFVSANLCMSPVYLSKTEANAGCCIVAPYEITQGTVKSVSVRGKGKNAITDISLGTVTITESTTVSEFSNAVVQHNRHYEYGDQITYFLVRQEVNDVTNVPMAEVDACFIVLDKTNDANLLSLVDSRGFSVQEGCLAAKSSNDFGNHGMVWIHSRKQSGKTFVSTQYLVCENSLLTEYQSEEAYQEAVDSYGGTSDAYLTPGGKLSPSTSSKPNNSGKPSTPNGGGSDIDNPSTLSNPGNSGTGSSGTTVNPDSGDGTEEGSDGGMEN